MRILRDFISCPEACRGAVVALGNFDGVHIGHQAILSACVETAKKEKRPAAVMTFEPHPREFFAHGAAPLRLCSLSRKLRLLEAAGIEIIFLARFNKALAATTAQEFVERILARDLGVRHVVTGYNFAFGKGRRGDTDFLEARAKEIGFGFTRVAPVNSAAGEPVSSSAIRALLVKGNVDGAARLLGRPYIISGRVAKGDGRGKTLGFPTANLPLSGLFLPRFGIYAARIKIGKEDAWHDAAASLGVRPMFAVPQPLLEVHAFGIKQDFYGQPAEVALVKFLREEKMFESREALTQQMAMDCRQAQSVLERKECAYG